MNFNPASENFPPSTLNPPSFESYGYEGAMKQPALILSNSKLPKNPSNNYIDYMTSTIITHTSTACQHSKTLTDLKYVFEHLRLENFKTQSCKVKGPHNFKMCPFFHNISDKRRMGNFYSSEFCEQISRSDHCSNGEFCKKSHNLVEQLYSSDQYKTKFCSFFPKNIELCDYGRYCSFAHDESEILVDLIHNHLYDDDFFIFIYKTVWCPFTFFQHDKNLCVYAHNFQDFRRKPINNKYSNVACPSWNESSQISNYMDGCPKGSACDKCHGWFEFEYHPLNYKTKVCEKKTFCSSKPYCPYYHDNDDMRIVSQELLWNMFKLVPKNRIVSKTFKVTKNDNIFFEINSKAAKNFLCNQRNLTNKNKALKSNKVNSRLNSLPQIDSSNAMPYSYEPAAIDCVQIKSKSSLQSIPNFGENDSHGSFSELWMKQNQEKKPKMKKMQTFSMRNISKSFEDKPEEYAFEPAANNPLINEKEHEECLETQFKNILKNICEDENDDLTPGLANEKK